MKRSIPSIEEELSLLMEGERWWGEEPFKPKITFDQNRMVRKIVRNYLEERHNERAAPEHSPFPDSDFVDFFQGLAGTGSDFGDFKDSGEEDSGTFPGIEETEGDNLETQPDDQPSGGEAGAEDIHSGQEGGGDLKDDVELELSGKPSDPDTTYVLLDT